MGTTTAQTLPLDVTTKQLSDGNSAGTLLGRSPTDLIGFFGATPVTQPSSPSATAVTRGLGTGVIITVSSAAASPSAPTVSSATEKAITLLNTSATVQVLANDLIYVNKPTSQAGLGVGNVRVSAANVLGVTFSNFTAATITPTTSQNYTVVALRGIGALTPTLTPAAVAPTTIAEQQFAVTGLTVGQLVQVNKPTAQAGLDIVGCRIVSNNVLGITFANLTAATITPTAGESYTVFGLAGIDAASNVMLVESLQSPASVANATSAEQGLTVTGLATTDTIQGVQKPTSQAGLIVGGWRVSAANTLGLTFGNVTAATITPTATETYGISLYRPSPVAPLLLYSQTLTPVAVAANTTAEQTFTVTGLVASSPVWVNKPSATPGLGIVGVRVSAANTLAINYGNVTAASITPPAETYIIGNFQLPVGDASSAWITNDATGSATGLVDTIRAQLVSLGLIAGS